MRRSGRYAKLIATFAAIVMNLAYCVSDQQSRVTTTQPTTTRTETPTTTTQPTTTTTRAPATGRIAFTRYQSYTDSPWNREDDSEVFLVDVKSKRERPLTDQTSSRNPVWSPDGDRITFTSHRYGRDGYSEIFVVNADGNNLRQLTRNHQDYGPVFSPDGSRIAFGNDGHLFVMGADGLNLVQITKENAGKLAWSPDSSRIAFVGRQNNDFDDIEVFVVDANGHNQQQLTDLNFRKSRSVVSLQWSPDGTRVAFTHQGDIFVADADSGDLTRLTYSAENNWPVWSPDSTRITFQSHRDTDMRRTDGIGIYVIDADGDNLKQLTYSSALQWIDNAQWSNGAWSPDGARVAFQNRPGGEQDDMEIFVVDTDNGNLIQLTDNDYEDFLPVWSPDSTRVAFQNRPGGEQDDMEIFVVNADNKQLTQLTDNQYHDLDPVWSPDGTHIAFERVYQTEIFLMDDDGANQRQLTYDVDHILAPRWSPDGAHIAFSGNHQTLDHWDHQIFVMNSDGSNLEQLTNNALYHGPVWSPDGAGIAFGGYGITEGEAHGPPEVFVVDRDGRNLQQLSDTNSSGVGWIVWSPDGGRIAFINDLHGNRELYVVSEDGAHQQGIQDDIGGPPRWSPDSTRIASTILNDNYETEILISDADTGRLQPVVILGEKPAWSPDGERIAFTGQASEQLWDYEIFVMDSDGDNLLQLTDNDTADYGPYCTPPPTRVRSPYSLHCDNLHGRYWGEDPVWSPDGARIAYTSPRDGFMEVFVVDADGGNPRQLTSNDHPDYPKGWQSQEIHLEWSPDSNQIVFASDRDGDYEIYVVNADGSGLVQLTDNHYDDHYPAWSPDG